MSRKECTECKWFPCHDKKDTHSWCDKQWHEILADDCKYYERDTSESLTHFENTPEKGASEKRVNKNEAEIVILTKNCQLHDE